MFRKLAKANPGGGHAARPQAHLSVIAPDVRIVGNLTTQGEVQIDGQVEGDITCQVLVVGEGARIVGAVTADAVRVHGRLEGKMDANAVMIARTGHVVGDVTHGTLEIEAGGCLEGHLIRKGSQAAQAAIAAAAPQAKLPKPKPAPEPLELQPEAAQ